MTVGRNSFRAKRRILAGAAAALLLGLTQGAPAARQGCGTPPLTRIGGNVPGISAFSVISPDGRYVAFQSGASDLDGDSLVDVFVFDRQTCGLELVSVNAVGVKGNGHSGDPSISDDGRFVAFFSMASNLDPADGNSIGDVFVRDRLLGTTALASVDSNEVQTNALPLQAEISGNGRFVVFVSDAAMVSDDTNDETDAFVRDLVAGTTERVSLSSTGAQGESPIVGGGVFDPTISQDGRHVAFVSYMTNLVPDDLNNARDVFVRDRMAGTTVRASLDSTGTEVTNPAVAFATPALTADAEMVFFSSNVNLVPGNTACDGIFVRNLVTQVTSCPLIDPMNAVVTQLATRPAVSADGRYVAFTSVAPHYVPGDTGGGRDVFVHDRLTGATRRANTTPSGMPDNSSIGEAIDISADGALVVFDSGGSNLVPPDTNGSFDVFVSQWQFLSSPPNVDVVRNGTFGASLQQWGTFATPDMSYIVADTSAGELQFYRVAPPPGTSNQAVVFQPTWAQFLPGAPVEGRFRLGNSSTVRKRISVLIHDLDFSDLFVCTFWLEPGTPMRNYVMRTHTTKFWSNATISFYAATAGSDGGFYRVDDVALLYQPTLEDDVTDCVDPTAPVAPGGDPGPAMLTNGDFAAGQAPWGTFGQISYQIVNNVFEFVRPPGNPAGVVQQATGLPLAQNDILTATFSLGNSSSVRKRVTLLLHDLDFSDLSACTFWLAPGQPMSPYIVRTFSTRPWVNATFSMYAATVGLDEWIRFTDATLQVTPGTTPLGTECLEPGADSAMITARGLLQSRADRMRAVRIPNGTTAVGTLALDDAVIAAHAVGAGPGVVWQRTLDLGAMRQPTLSFQSLFSGGSSTAMAQVSRDGASWITIASLPATAEWTTVDLDLSAFAGDIVEVRLLFAAAPPPPGLPPDSWRVRHVRLDRRR